MATNLRANKGWTLEIPKPDNWDKSNTKKGFGIREKCKTYDMRLIEWNYSQNLMFY